MKRKFKYPGSVAPLAMFFIFHLHLRLSLYTYQRPYSDPQLIQCAPDAYSGWKLPILSNNFLKRRQCFVFVQKLAWNLNHHLWHLVTCFTIFKDFSYFVQSTKQPSFPNSRLQATLDSPLIIVKQIILMIVPWFDSLGTSRYKFWPDRPSTVASTCTVASTYTVASIYTVPSSGPEGPTDIGFCPPSSNVGWCSTYSVGPTPLQVLYTHQYFLQNRLIHVCFSSGTFL